MTAPKNPETVEVSVVIAAWNAAGFVSSALDSALSQQGVTLEVIVADDASTDNTADTIQARAASENRVKLVRNDVNGGPSVARNQAIAAAEGKWIAVLDADDRFLPGRLARMVGFADECGADIAFDLIGEVDENGHRLKSSGLPSITSPKQWTLGQWIEDNQPGKPGMGTGYLKPLIRRATLVDTGLRYRESLRNSEDYALIAELLQKGATAWVVPEVGYLYTRRSGSISHRVGSHHLDALLAFESDFAALYGPFEAGLQTALLQRRRSLEDLLALAKIIDGLKAKRIGDVFKAIADRPRVAGVFTAWVLEVVQKRLSLAKHV